MPCLQLQSYLGGRWLSGQGKPVSLEDAATGVEVARLDATGLNLGEALCFGRERGGKALRKMTFHQRALMLKALAKHLLAHKENFYELSYATGATRTDSWIDIEGGIGTLFTYASKGRKELPNTHLIAEGAFEPLAKDGSFGGQHILTPLQGVAVQINAYNFPCWGMLEKLGPALLAGVPSLVKPASQTAYLAEAMVREMIASEILPEGALQLVCGSVGDLFEHLTCQDLVSFTGSASTGQKLCIHPKLVEQSVRFTMEADSLNAAVLGGDAGPGTPEYDLFLREARREMTVKAGQKCTAIRRLLVPSVHIEAVTRDLSNMLGKIHAGNPRDENVRMGPLVSHGQREEVLARTDELSGGAEIICGAWDAGSDGGERGAFLDPVLLRCDTPHDSPIVHSCEAFGPVATLMPYDGIDDAIILAGMGGGSLVVSAFTHHTDRARELVLGVAPWHGRVLVSNRDTANSSTGHGSPLPALIHGGPGRAGGGEEMGGIRGVKHFMARSAIQGSPAMLSAIAGRWCPNGPVQSDRHPFRKSLAELQIGDCLQSAPREIILEDIGHFAEFTGDTFYAHTDEDAARVNPFFEGRVAHGYLLVSFAAGLFVDPDPGPVLANYGIDNLRFLAPVYPGDTIRVSLVAKEISPREDEAYGEVRWDAVLLNQDCQLVAQYDVLTMVAKEWPLPEQIA